MELEKYQLSTGRSQRIFEFTSIGNKGEILKRITFSKMNYPGLYNLALGDVNPETGRVNYKKVTNNGDRDKVLATVVASVYAMFSRYPNIAIHLSGGDSKSRTRLYQIAISVHLDVFKEDFEIFGKLNDQIEGFSKSSNYEAFFIMLKKKS